LLVLDEAADFLQRIGVREQWPSRFTNNATWIAILEKVVERGEVFLARQRGHPVGVFTLCETPGLANRIDHSWGGVAGSAFYLYLLAIRRSVAGKGVAIAMLDWACSHASGFGRVLRLDCWAGNGRLKRFYKESGFESLGDVEITSTLDGRTYAVSRFQRRF
jgi:GNAT superfamily N-acetyltransferase